MGLFGDYVTEKGLKGLEDYKYHGIDHSIIAKYIGQPFWNTCVNFLPLWLAPNLVTLIGFFFIVLSYILTYIYLPNISGSAPSWVYYTFALNLFLYQTLDAIDGKQARRTGSSSPLGELFDHGCDAMTTVLCALTITSTIQLGAGPLLYFFIISCMVTFFAKQWEEFHTSVFELGYFNVTEAQLVAITIYAMTGFLGPDFWLQTVEIAGRHFAYNELAASFCLIGSVPTTLNSVKETVLFYVLGKQPKVSTATQAALQLIPVIAVIAFSALWFKHSTHLLYNHPHAVILAVGFTFCNLIGRIVLARVCKQDLNVIQPIVLPFVIGYAIFNFNLTTAIDEGLFLQGVALLSIVAYLHFALSVIRIICGHLMIKCLSIPYKRSA